MVVRAYILIQTEVGTAQQVKRAVEEISGIVNADSLTGPYDVIAVAEADDVDELGRMVMGQVQLTEGITQTTTMPVFNL